MRDEEIVTLYWQRDESAVRQTEQKYGRYLSGIAWQILYDRRDSEESVNDTYLKTWNSIPPHRPEMLASYLAKITRQLSIDRLRARARQKRGGGEYALSLTELEDCVSGNETPEQKADLRLLGQAISGYLHTLPPSARIAFVSRYFYLDPIKTIAARSGMSEPAVKSLLYRIRTGLRKHLQGEGFDL